MPAIWTALVVEQGATFAHGWAVTYNGAALGTGWVAAGQIRTEPGGALIGTFEAAVNQGGAVVIAASAAETAAWDFTVAAYDVVATGPDDEVLVVAAGTIELVPGVTA